MCRVVTIILEQVEEINLANSMAIWYPTYANSNWVFSLRNLNINLLAAATVIAIAFRKPWPTYAITNTFIIEHFESYRSTAT